MLTVRLLGTQHQRTITVAREKTETIEDVFTWLGAGTGSGALESLSSGSETAPLVWSRTYTGGDGTYGQWIDGALPGVFKRRSIVLGLHDDGVFRTNVGFVNRGATPVTLTASILGESGVVSSVPVIVPARGATQTRIQQLFPGVDLSSLDTFALKVDAQSEVLAYASVIDNLSGDPVFIAGY